eukprot:scaffold40459_cov255-Skeletonema_dohrnii-CCMP3373.AAC.1
MDQLIDGRDTNSYADQGRHKSTHFPMQQQPLHMGRIPIPTLIKADMEAAGPYTQKHSFSQ